MSYYVVSVQPRKEESFLTIARKRLATELARFYWPRRKLTIRRRGRRKEVLAPIFSGYVFIEAEQVDDHLFAAVKQLPGFYRFLESNDRIRALGGDDLELVAHFVRFGEVIGKSKVTFDEHSRIEVSEGPLAGLEGRIVKVDRRKQRAKIRLDLYQESFLVDLGFELLTPSASSQRGAEKGDD
jgi:transcription termination/antitermination protein NusG